MRAGRRLSTLVVVSSAVATLTGCQTIRDVIQEPDAGQTAIASESAPGTSSGVSPSEDARPSPDTGPDIEPCTAAQQTMIETVIDGQLDAFVADDWPAALALASPAFRQRFEAPELGRMIEQSFPVVANQVKADHGACLVAGDEARVLSTVTDDRGDSIELTYLLEAQPDGSWLIGGAVPTEPLEDDGPLI